MTVRAYLSFGAGVQSTALAMLALNGDQRLLDALETEAAYWKWSQPSPLPELYVFADTGDEPAALYPHIDKMRQRIEDAGARFVRGVNRKWSGGLLQHMLQTAKPYVEYQADGEPISSTGGISSPPFFVLNNYGETGITRRQCTSHFKVKVINRITRDHFDVTRGRTKDGSLIYSWLGISADEMQRMKVSHDKWRRVSHPLVFMRWHREHCREYLKELAIEARRSACVYCPYHSTEEWQDIREVKEDWDRVLQLDDLLENIARSQNYFEHERPWAGINGPMFLVRSCQRMREVDFTIDNGGQLDLFDNECAGVCGI